MKSIRATCAPILLLCFGTMVRADLVPGALQLGGPAFVQPFSTVTISKDGTSSSTFLSDLSCCSLPSNYVVDIIGNFFVSDPLNSSPSFSITGISILQGGGGMLTPASGPFNFDGLGSVTFTDSVRAFNQVTFNSSDFTFAFAFNLDPTKQYYFSLLTTGLDPDSQIVFDDAETFTPEPGFYGILALGISCLLFALRRRGTSLR
jgi:hypothetical protein